MCSDRLHFRDAESRLGKHAIEVDSLMKVLFGSGFFPPSVLDVWLCSSGTLTSNRHQAARRDAVAQRRPVSRWTHARCLRRAEPAECLLRRRGEWRRMEDHRLRPHLAANLRSAADRIHRRHRSRAFRSEYRLCRQRRRPASSRPVGRRWHLQVNRRRRDLDAPRAARRATNLADGD